MECLLQARPPRTLKQSPLEKKEQLWLLLVMRDSSMYKGVVRSQLLLTIS